MHKKRVFYVWFSLVFLGVVLVFVLLWKFGYGWDTGGKVKELLDCGYYWDRFLLFDTTDFTGHDCLYDSILWGEGS